MLFGLFFLVDTPVFAQIGSITQSTASVTLVPSPRFPEPHQLTTFSLDDYSVDTSGARVQWFVDGVENTSAQNQRALQVSAGDFGEHTSVTVVVTLPKGVSLRASHTIVPTRIDMIVTADTLTPAFYKGRALPSNGSVVTVTALPFVEGGASLSSLSYLWKVNGTVQNGGEQRGKNTFVYVPEFEDEAVVSVDVIDTNGAVIAGKSIVVPIYEPELHFYEINPLRGMASHALISPFTFIGEEITVRAEPYYVSKDLFSENPFTEWSLDGKPLVNPNVDQQEIVLRKEGGSGRFSVGFHIRNLEQLLQGVKNSFTIQF